MISAIILAAGESRRMGEQKLLMRWGDVTVIEHIISTFQRAGLEDIVVVTGSHRNEIEKIVSTTSADDSLRCVFNENFSTGEMLASIQCGLRAVAAKGSRATLIALGDQPQVRERTVRRVCDAFHETRSPLIVPSFKMRRGHPWLIGKELWGEFLGLAQQQTPREFLDRHREEIRYVDAEDDSVLADLDTPEEYRAARPK